MFYAQSEYLDHSSYKLLCGLSLYIDLINWWILKYSSSCENFNYKAGLASLKNGERQGNGELASLKNDVYENFNFPSAFIEVEVLGKAPCHFELVPVAY
jgi:hypothetical protein